MAYPVTDITGQTFGRLTAIKRVGLRHGKALWECACSCGKITEKLGINLRQGMTKSCGCLRYENSRRGKKTHD